MSETVTMTLTDFLLARIAEDEADAHALAKELGRWEREKALNGADGSQGSIAVTAIFGTASDPARVLAECEAKRQIVKLWAEEWDEWHGPGSGLTRTRMTDDQFLRVLTAERVLGALALPYADHEDFREEWKDRAHE